MATKRLYIGGLSHTISEKDLKDRFGKFGDVQDVELLTRKDEDGVPYKTFGYININISDDNYKRCMTVLNKSKWKGGMLQIEVAKESFLHRLAQERQQAAEKIQPLPEDEKEKFVESLKSVGIEDFHMKAAVPGTEVPGHKDWVVSKFGRVLPVLHLKCQGKSKVMKYDPSKHSHNIKRLENPADVPSLTPVSQLTWEIPEANDDISKKRRGEFPPLKKHSKIRKDSPSKLTANSQSDVSINGGCKKSNGSLDKGQNSAGGNKPTKLKQAPALTKPQVPGVRVLDSGFDSDEEIRMLVAQQRMQDPTAEDDDDNDHLEVVGDDFLVSRTKPDHHPSVRPSEDDEMAYDSADTDEILTSSKTPKGAEQPKPEACGQNSQMATNSSQKDTTDVKKPCKKAPSKLKPCKKVPSESKPHLSESDSDEDEEEDEEEKEEEESDDSDYEAMFTNCHRLEISLADLEQLAKESSTSPHEDDDDGSDPQAGPSQEAAPLHQTKACQSSLPKKGTTPEEILAAILGEDSSDEETGKKKKKKKNPSTPLPAFQGTKALIGTLQNTEDCYLKRQLDDDAKTEVVSKKKKLETLVALNHSASDANAKSVNSPLLIADSLSSSGSSISKALGSSGDQSKVSKKVVPKDSDGVKTKQLSKTEESLPESDSSSSGSISTNEESESSEEEEDASPGDMAVLDPSKRPQRASVPGTQQQDNQRRLAAMEQRQKEAEQQKKLIQGALAVGTPATASKSKHIVFGSDDESDEGQSDEGQSASEVSTPKKSLFQDSQCLEEDGSDVRKPSADRKASCKEKNTLEQDASKLFDSSEDEDEDSEDGERFQIKPQFEGKSGQKLMQLQSRFGADERFHMDSRFLESDDESDVPANKPEQEEAECELEQEKKKNLEILGNLLGTNIQSGDNSKASTKGKTFRDISALQYDPTREEHAAFETKTEEPKKESKKARRKKREEAEKLPEVSKEIYYDVAADLKAVFGTTKEHVDEEKEKAVAWDKEEEEEEKEEEEEEEEQTEQADAETLLPSSLSAETEQSSGFKFSFFDDKADDTSLIDEYKVETLKGPKVAWQADPRFQDSSSEDEVEDEVEDQDQTTAATATEQPVQTKKAFFFFHPADERLKEGPRTFYQSANLDDDREQWEEKRTLLIGEYRKKHKDARRKLRVSQRN